MPEIEVWRDKNGRLRNDAVPYGETPAWRGTMPSGPSTKPHFSPPPPPSFRAANPPHQPTWQQPTAYLHNDNSEQYSLPSSNLELTGSFGLALLLLGLVTGILSLLTTNDMSLFSAVLVAVGGICCTCWLLLNRSRLMLWLIILGALGYGGWMAYSEHIAHQYPHAGRYH